MATASIGGGGVGRVGDGAHEQLLQRAGAPEQHLALVGEVAEERSLREPRPLGDLGHGGVLEAALAVERERGLLEPAARVWLPTRHVTILAVMTATDIACYSDDSN